MSNPGAILETKGGGTEEEGGQKIDEKRYQRRRRRRRRRESFTWRGNPSNGGRERRRRKKRLFLLCCSLQFFSGPRPRMNESLLSSGSSSSTHIWAGGGKRQHRVFKGKKLKKNHLHISRKTHFCLIADADAISVCPTRNKEGRGHAAPSFFPCPLLSSDTSLSLHEKEGK